MKIQLALATLSLPAAAAPQAPVFPSGSLVAPGAQSSDGFGEAVEMDGGWIVGSLPLFDGAITQQGAVYAWPRSSGGPGAPIEILSPDPLQGGRFGLSIELEDGRLTVGEMRSPIDSAGRVHLYEEQAGTWALQASLVRSSTSTLRFGESVARDGDLVAVGCPGSFVQGQSRGAVEVFREVGGAWVSDGYLTASDGYLSSDFGGSVAVSGDRIIVGDSRWRNGSNQAEGAIYTYEKTGGAWVETARLNIQPGSGDVGFGTSLDVEGGRLAVGATSGNVPGAVYLFSYSGGVWTQASRVQPPALSSFARFGSSVALEGAQLAVGAPSDTVVGFGTGAAWVLDVGGALPVPLARFVEEGSTLFLGDSVATDGLGGFTAGAPIATVTGSPVQSGALFTFDLPNLIGVPFCAPVDNSTSRPGRMSAIGSTEVAQNNVTLIASQLPNNSFGYFLASRSQGLVNQPGGSQGVLCLGGSVGRFVGPGQIQSSGSIGVFDLGLDLGQMPTPNGLIQVLAGETWNFQTWYRDSVQGAATSNFTEGLEVNFS